MNKRKSKIKTFKVENDTWSYLLIIRLGGTKKQALAYFNKKFDSEIITGNIIECTASTIYSDGEKSHMIWFSELVPGASIVSHEALHSVQHVLQESGMGLMSESNEEAYAYLLGWTVSQIGRRIWQM